MTTPMNESSTPEDAHDDPASDDTAPLVDEEPEPARRGGIPLLVMGISLAVLLGTLGVVGFLFTRSTTPQATQDSAPRTPEPTGTPVLPVTAGEFSRDPGNNAPQVMSGVDRSILTASAVYRRDGEPALVVVAGRPVGDSRVLLEQIQARGIRDMGNGALCGRDQNDLDVCAVRRYQTAVFVEGLRSQTPDELVQAARTIVETTQ